MKRIVLAVLVLSIFTLFGCEKDKHEKSQYPFVYLHDCFSKTFSNDRIRLCLEEVIEDVRCPEDVDCIWGGYARARFTFTKNNTDHSLILYISNIDTVVDGYKIRFVGLTPRPRVHPAPGPNKPKVYKAEVEITRL